jgi:hypothetical protein
MNPIRCLMSMCLALALACMAQSADFALQSAHGVIDKASKDSLSFQPHGADGKLGKSVTLALTGTSKITQVTLEKRGGKMVPVQKDIDAKDLVAKQSIAVIYTDEKSGHILLSAVVQPPPETK